MSAPEHSTITNRLLASMSKADFARLSSHLEALDLPVRFHLAQMDQPIGHVYFPNSGIGSIVAASPEGQRVEAGIFGRDAFGPTGVVLGASLSPHTIFMQVAGQGFRITSAALIEAVGEMPSFHSVLLRYVHTLQVQMSYTALSNAVHQIDERLARWLLMCHDRADGDELPLTHEFMSLMLAVRRSSITSSLQVLKGNGFIQLERGHVTIRNREGLEEFARDAYGKPETTYRELIGTSR